MKLLQGMDASICINVGNDDVCTTLSQFGRKQKPKPASSPGDNGGLA
jgi:hypothetical protein